MGHGFKPAQGNPSYVAKFNVITPILKRYNNKENQVQTRNNFMLFIKISCFHALLLKHNEAKVIDFQYFNFDLKFAFHAVNRLTVHAFL
jgi:hypothetical protein